MVAQCVGAGRRRRADGLRRQLLRAGDQWIWALRRRRPRAGRSISDRSGGARRRRPIPGAEKRVVARVRAGALPFLSARSPRGRALTAPLLRGRLDVCGRPGRRRAGRRHVGARLRADPSSFDQTARPAAACEWHDDARALGVCERRARHRRRGRLLPGPLALLARDDASRPAVPRRPVAPLWRDATGSQPLPLAAAVSGRRVERRRRGRLLDGKGASASTPAATITTRTRSWALPTRR